MRVKEAHTSVEPSSLLQRSLPGEYVAMFLAVQSAFIAISWGFRSIDVLTQIGLVFAAVWAMARVVGVGSRFSFAPIVTVVMLGITLWISAAGTVDSPEWLVSGPFSAVSMGLILGVILGLDLLQFAESRGEQLFGTLRRNGLTILRYGVPGFVAVYAIVVPLVQEVIATLNPPANTALAMDRLTLAQNMLFKFVESFTAIWFFVVGAVVGSFLNVVIYRLPRRLTLISGGSHCPACHKRIPAADNLPLVGWLRLDGRCRNCDSDISARYPVVEGVVGALFLLLFFVELISGGINLPVRNPNSYAGVQWILFYTKWDLVGLYTYHCILLCTIFSWAMIRRDGHQVSLRSAATMLALTVSAPLLLPHLLPWPFNSDGTTAVTYTAQDAALTSLLGLAAAGVVAMLPAVSRRIWRSPRQDPPQFDLPSWLIIGAGWGWQAVLGVLVLLILWTVAWAVVAPSEPSTDRQLSEENGRLPLTNDLQRLALPGAVLIHLCVWRQIASLFG